MESLLDHILRVCGEIQRGQFFSAEPADFGGIAGGQEFSANAAAEKIDQHIVILHALVRIAEDAVVDSEQVAGLDESPVSSWASRMAASRTSSPTSSTPQGSTTELAAAGGALDQEDAVLFDDDGSDADQRGFGEFSFHVSI